MKPTAVIMNFREMKTIMTTAMRMIPQSQTTARDTTPKVGNKFDNSGANAVMGRACKKDHNLDNDCNEGD